MLASHVWAPDLPVTPERAIDRPRDPDCESLQSTAQKEMAVGFDEEVDVVRLQRELEYSESSARGDGDGGACGAHSRAVPQGGQAGDCPQCDVDGAAD